MKQYARVGVLASGFVLFVGVSVASAFVLDAKTDEQKLRRDVGKRSTKYIQCLVKAVTKCEKKGGHSGAECHLATGVVDYAGDLDLDPKNKQPAKFQADIAKCDDKYTPDKKGIDYVGIGCPGDCDLAAGTQSCVTMANYESFIEGTVGFTPKVQLPILAAAIDNACATDVGGTPSSTDEANIECVTDQAAVLTKYSKGLGKCYEKCENDYKDKKGNGGPNDLPNCLVSDAGNDDNFEACADAALTKATKKTALSPSVAGGVLTLVHAALDQANDGLYNRSDFVTPGDNPCGTCGDGIRQGAEECDLSDDALCGGPCNANCTCP